MAPTPFLRGIGRFRRDPRLPQATWPMMKIPVGLRVELAGSELVIGYRTKNEDLGFRGDAAGRTFEVFFDGSPVVQIPAVYGEGTISWNRDVSGRVIVYTPEGMRPQ